MFKSGKKVTIEFMNENNGKLSNVTNPISSSDTKVDKIASMVKTILEEELPMLKHNSLLYDLVLYSLLEKMNTVQNVENVLSYIKDNNVKEVRDVTFRKGEVCIKCSV